MASKQEIKKKRRLAKSMLTRDERLQRGFIIYDSKAWKKRAADKVARLARQADARKAKRI